MEIIFADYVVMIRLLTRVLLFLIMQLLLRVVRMMVVLYSGMSDANITTMFSGIIIKSVVSQCLMMEICCSLQAWMALFGKFLFRSSYL